MSPLVQTPGILPGWMVTVPVLVIVVLLIWLLVKGDHDICNYCNDDGDPCPRCGGGRRDPINTLVSDALDHPAKVEMTANEVRECVIALWNENDGWIPGAAYRDLAYVLGVEPHRLTHWSVEQRRHVEGRP